MISIAEAISDLLFARDTVVVPGLGAFVKKPVSAKVNPVANYFAMPSSMLTFDANLREDNELVINYLSEKNDIPQDEARRVLVMFVSDCFNSMKEGKKVALKNIGTLSYDWAGDVVFESVDASNYNADAFGLCDISPKPVLRSKTKEEIKEEIAQQQKDKNTPVTVDERAVHEKDMDEEDDEESKPHRGWLWVLLGLLLLAAIGFGLHYFKVVDFSQWFKPQQPALEPWKVTIPAKSLEWEPKETVIEEPDTTHLEPPVEALPEANIRIVAGCFAQEENALAYTNSLKDNGYPDAFYESRSKMWYVCFGRYITEDEANAVLTEIRSTTDYQAWVLK